MSHFSVRPRTLVHTCQSEDLHVCAFTNEDRTTEDFRAHACTRQCEDLHVYSLSAVDRKTKDVCALTSEDQKSHGDIYLEPAIKGVYNGVVRPISHDL